MRLTPSCRSAPRSAPWTLIARHGAWAQTVSSTLIAPHGSIPIHVTWTPSTFPVHFIPRGLYPDCLHGPAVHTPQSVTISTLRKTRVVNRNYLVPSRYFRRAIFFYTSFFPFLICLRISLLVSLLLTARVTYSLYFFPFPACVRLSLLHR